jgi:hypothetical protein
MRNLDAKAFFLFDRDIFHRLGGFFDKAPGGMINVALAELDFSPTKRRHDVIGSVKALKFVVLNVVCLDVMQNRLFIEAKKIS